ncbi:MAG: pitrilysin family protein [Desulfobaccales bacterium]
MGLTSKNWLSMAKGRLTMLVLACLLRGLLGHGPAEASEQVLGVREQLPNGLVWLFSQQSGLPMVSLQLFIKAGALQDPKGKEGLANLTASLLLSGGKGRSAPQIAQEVDFIGARLGARGGDDFATISLVILKKDLGAGLGLLQDVLLHPAFAPAEVQLKVAQFEAALKSEEDDPMVVARRTFAQDLYGDFPYGHPVMGTPQGLAAITPQDLAQFHRTYYRPNNAVLSVVGDLTQDEARQWVTKIFGAWAAAPLPSPKPAAIPPLTERKVVLIDRDISQANIILGNLGINRQNPDFYACQVMNYILGGGGFSSRLMDEIREHRGLAYSVSSSFSPGLGPGPFTVSLETKNPSAAEAISQVRMQLKLIMNQPVQPKELEDAKSHLIGSFPRKMDSMSKRAQLMGYVEIYGLGLNYPWNYPKMIQDLTPEDIQRVAEKYLQPDKYLLVVVGKKSAMPSLTGKTDLKTEEKRNEEKKSIP